jgi:transposase
MGCVMFLKRHTKRKDGKLHVYYSLSESVRVGRHRTLQKRLLNLGELNTTQIDRWQRSIEVLEENGESCQMRLFTDRDGGAPQEVDRYNAEVLLSSMELRRPRSFGAPWMGCRLWQELKLDEFWSEKLKDHRGPVEWAKVLELLAVNRLCAPGSELSIHERWFGRTAMDFLLGCDESVAGKDRLYRALDKAVLHKDALLEHLQQRWQDLFAADCQILLYDLTSTYFEGEAEQVDKARRGYSRDHRPDCLQVLVALVVSSEGFPLCYEVFEGNRNDVTTLKEVLDTIERKYGYKGRVWVFDRGVVSEENLENLRQRGAAYLVGTPKHRLKDFEQELLHGDWQEVSGRPEVKVQLLEHAGETYVLARSAARASKESAMRRRQLVGLHRKLQAMARTLARGQLQNRDKMMMRLGRLEERYASVWPYLHKCEVDAGGDGKPRLVWVWSKERLRHLRIRDGAYLLRTNLDPMDPECLWQQYIQLTDVESAFRCLKSELAIRPIWHHSDRRVEAHIMVAFLGYCLWVCLKQRLKTLAESLTPTRVIESFESIQMVEVWFRLRDGRRLCLPRITQPEKDQALILHQLDWQLPQQPPPRIYQSQLETSCVDDRRTSRN